jgi:hypothetical protein
LKFSLTPFCKRRGVTVLEDEEWKCKEENGPKDEILVEEK